MAKPSRKLSRRRFLQTSMAAGAALSLPWLTGCGDGSDDGGGPGAPNTTRRSTRLHFDLSHSRHSGPFVLHAIGTRANQRHLTPHTAATRRQFKRGSRRLQALRDDQLTHFAQAVDLPTNRVQQIWVSAGTAAAAPIVMSRIFCGGVDPGDPDSWTGPRDYAIALIFHHPEIARLDPDQAAIVCGHIESSYLDGLEQMILRGDAFRAVPVTDLEDQPVLNQRGEQLVQQDPSDALLLEADAVVQEVLARIFDDPALEGANWHAASGRTSVTVPGTAELTATAQDDFDAFFPADPNHGSSAHGIYFTGLKLLDPDPLKRTIQLEVKNSHFRWAGVWADYLDPNDNGVESIEAPHLDGFFERDIFNIRSARGDLVRSRYLAVVGPTSDYLGIPVRIADNVETRLRFDLPPGAVRAHIRFLSLGLRGDGMKQPGREAQAAFNLPIYLTGIFNIGLPAFLIASAVGDTNTIKSFYQLATDKGFLVAIAQLVTLDLFKSIDRDDARPWLLSFGSKFVSLALKALPTFAAALFAAIGASAAAQAVPIVGWGVKLASITAATSKLLQAVTEVAKSPPLVENTIALLLTTRVSIRHDPLNGAGFPATATRWEMQATYNGRVGQTIKGDLDTTLSEPINRQFRVPSGGTGRIDVWFLTDNNWIAAHGTTGDFTNLAPSGVLEQTITIKENLVPITQMTRYHHRQKLVRENDRYAWRLAQDAPPTQTAFSLACDDDSLCDLNGITLSENAAIVGYAWQARSRTVPLCGGGPTSSPLHRIQNLSFAQRPNDSLKRALCGYTGKALLTYELYARPGDPGRYFYLDPNGSDGGYHLREVSLDSAPFDQTMPLSWGQFAQQQNSLAIHPSGYVVGINTQSHNLEILKLPEFAAPDELVAASVLAAGRGTRIGLLDTPYAVGVDLLRKAIFVLEGGNARVQAFDVNGNPVKRFLGGTSEVRPLVHEPNATYLDMAVETTGLIYVLSFVGSGRNSDDYRLDVYDPESPGDAYTSRTTGVAAGKLAVGLWRNVYTLNYEPLVGPDGLEPSISQWIPSTPDGCSQTDNPFCQRL